MKNESESPAREYPDQPCLAVGAVVFRDDQVLLVRRGKPPAADQWAIPGGRVNLGETLREAAEREIREETGILIRALEPVFQFESIHRDSDGRIRFHYVIIDLSGTYLDGEIQPGDDATDARWVSRSELRELPVNPVTLKLLKTHYAFE